MRGPNETPPTVAAVGGAEEAVSRKDGSDFHAAGQAAQAAHRIEGESYARAWMDRLHAGTARPGELAVFLGFLTGDMLYGACRVIEKALEGQRDA